MIDKQTCYPWRRLWTRPRHSFSHSVELKTRTFSPLKICPLFAEAKFPNAYQLSYLQTLSYTRIEIYQALVIHYFMHGNFSVKMRKTVIFFLSKLSQPATNKLKIVFLENWEDTPFRKVQIINHKGLEKWAVCDSIWSSQWYLLTPLTTTKPKTRIGLS